MPRRTSRATCWRSRTISTARSPRSARSFAPTRPRASSSPASKRPRASSTRSFQRHGITRIEVGRRAARSAPPPGDDRNADATQEPGTIVEEMQAGYMMKDRLLRPALVGVAKKPDLMHFAVVDLALGGEAEPRFGFDSNRAAAPAA